MLQKIDPREIQKNVFSLIGDQWMLIAAGDAEKCNMMTASWGGLGVLWHKNVATIYVRPQRYTYGLIEKLDTFSLSFFTEEYREQLKLCGSKSGREIDKVKECGLTVEKTAEHTPYFAQAELVLICRKLYYSDLDPAHFLDASIGDNYKNHDYHRMYMGEILSAYAAK